MDLFILKDIEIIFQQQSHPEFIENILYENTCLILKKNPIISFSSNKNSRDIFLEIWFIRKARNISQFISLFNNISDLYSPNQSHKRNQTRICKAGQITKRMIFSLALFPENPNFHFLQKQLTQLSKMQDRSWAGE
mgnify:CR=1 FL=1